MTRPIRRVSGLAVVATIVALAVPAAGIADGRGCRDGAYCLWTKPNYDGKKLVVETNKLFNFPGFMNNKASSVKNRVGDNRTVLLYAGKNGVDGFVCIMDGAGLAFLGQANNAPSSGDVISC